LMVTDVELWYSRGLRHEEVMGKVDRAKEPYSVQDHVREAAIRKVNEGLSGRTSWRGLHSLR